MDYDIILCGRITGYPRYKVKFAQACVAAHTRFPGTRIFNPAELPDDRDYRWYMKTCVDAIFNRAAPNCVIIRLKDWNDSKGSRAESALADCLGIPIIEQWW